VILTGQRATWRHGEQTLVEDPSRRTVVPAFTDERNGTNLFMAVCKAMADMKHEYGIGARVLDMTGDEWHRVRFSRAFIDTVKYLAASTTSPALPGPEFLGQMFGLEVRVDGVMAGKPAPPPPSMNCRNCGAPPKLLARACVHCGTPWAESGTPTREPRGMLESPTQGQEQLI
jgi:hypothetical protein